MRRIFDVSRSRVAEDSFFWDVTVDEYSEPDVS